MEKARKKLQMLVISLLIVAAMIIITFETNINLPGWWSDKTMTQFVVLTIMEIGSLLIIPLSLYLFKIKKIKTLLIQQKDKALVKWGTARIIMIAITMIVNILGYYCFMNVAFAYLAIILFITLLLIFPTNSKCHSETNQ